MLGDPTNFLEWDTCLCLGVSFAYRKLRPTAWSCTRLQSGFRLIYWFLATQGPGSFLTLHIEATLACGWLLARLTAWPMPTLYTCHTCLHGCLPNRPQAICSDVQSACNYCALLIRMHMFYEQETRDKVREHESAPSPMHKHIRSQSIPRKYYE